MWRAGRVQRAALRRAVLDEAIAETMAVSTESSDSGDQENAAEVHQTLPRSPALATFTAPAPQPQNIEEQTLSATEDAGSGLDKASSRSLTLQLPAKELSAEAPAVEEDARDRKMEQLERRIAVLEREMREQLCQNRRKVIFYRVRMKNRTAGTTTMRLSPSSFGFRHASIETLSKKSRKKPRDLDDQTKPIIVIYGASRVH